MYRDSSESVLERDGHERRHDATATVAGALVDCIAEGRTPREEEIAYVAAWMRIDIRGRGGRQRVRADPLNEKQLLALARAALGVRGKGSTRRCDACGHPI